MGLLWKWEGNPQIHMELQAVPNRLSNIEKVKQSGRVTFSVFKTYYKAMQSKWCSTGIKIDIQTKGKELSIQK